MDLKPGGELDALVAEKVMGWKRMTYAQIYAKRDPASHGYINDHRLTTYWHSDELDPRMGTNKACALAEGSSDYYDPEEAWSPSTEIAAAWEVVNKIPFVMRDGWANEPVKMKFRLEHTDEGLWRAGYEYAYWANEFDSESELAPHAICLAALKAVEK